MPIRSLRRFSVYVFGLVLSLVLLSLAQPERAIAIEIRKTTNLDLTLRGVSFNPALRTDRGPSQGLSPTATFAPPDARRRDLVSTAVPSAMAASRLRQMRRAGTFWVAPGEVSLSWEVVFDQPRFAGLVPTLGTSQGSTIDSRMAATTMTVGRDGVTDPLARRWLFHRGTPLSVGTSGYFDSAFFLDGVMDVGIERCHEHQPGFVDKYDWPRRLSARCESDLARRLCRSTDTRTSQMPFSVLDCRVDIEEDTGFKIFVSDARGQTVRAQFPTLDHQPLETSTHFRVVDGPRLLSRPLVHVPFRDGQTTRAYECIRFYEGPSLWANAQSSIPCTEQDHAAIAAITQREAQCDAWPTPTTLQQRMLFDATCRSPLQSSSPLAGLGGPSFTRLRSTWRFKVLQVPTTGELHETFSDQLRIAEVRLYVERGGVKQYILADEIQRIAVNGQDCEIPDASVVAVVEMSRCIENENDATGTRRNVVATPTWVEPDVQTLAEWEVTLRTYNQGGVFTKGLAARPGEMVFLEFMLVRR